MADPQQIRVEQDGHLLAQATVSITEETREARAQVHVASGHLPVGTRQKVADAVYLAVAKDRARHLTATVPLGDVELVEGIRSHLSEARLHAAGATCIIDGDVKAD